MKNKEYTKINLRDFRHNLTQLKDSIEAGTVFEIYEKNVPIFICASRHYELKPLTEDEQTPEEFDEILAMPVEKSKLPNDFDVDKEYRKLLEQKYRK